MTIIRATSGILIEIWILAGRLDQFKNSDSDLAITLNQMSTKLNLILLQIEFNFYLKL